MKSIRHERVYEIIKSRDIETQEELAEALRSEGINVTQATVSRDIKELNLIKILSNSGKYKYAPSVKENNYDINEMETMLMKTAISIEKIDKFLVLKTITASAGLAGEALDSLKIDGLVGTIAGDNTVLIIGRDDGKVEAILSYIQKIIQR